jgi:hypothetical protein
VPTAMPTHERKSPALPCIALVGKLGERSRTGQLLLVKLDAYVDTHLTTEMLDMPEGEPTEEHIRQLLENRPDFAPTLEHHENLFHRPGTLF